MLVPLLIYRLRKRKPEPVEHPSIELNFGFVTYSGLDLEPDHSDCVWLPASFMRTLVPDPTFNKIARYEREYVADIAADIVEHGIQEPLLIAVDRDGVCLHDGHHRIVAGVTERFPVKLERSERIRKHKVPMNDLVEVLWKKCL